MLHQVVHIFTTRFSIQFVYLFKLKFVSPNIKFIIIFYNKQEKHKNFVTFQALTVVSVKIIVFWDRMSWSLVKRYRHFGGSFYEVHGVCLWGPLFYSKMPFYFTLFSGLYSQSEERFSFSFLVQYSTWRDSIMRWECLCRPIKRCMSFKLERILRSTPVKFENYFHAFVCRLRFKKSETGG